MSGDRTQDSGRAGQQQDIPEKVIDEVKRSILHGGGYKRPPEHSRFKKGQSGNPNGRPRRSKPDLGGDRSANSLVLIEAERLLSVREGNEVRSMPTIDAIIRAETASALKGSPFSQRAAINRYERAERERRQKIEVEIDYWERYVESSRRVIADALAKRETAPNILPHPDDVILDREKGVRFRGPINEEEMERLQDTLRLRDILIMQAALDQRATPDTESDDPLDQPGSARIFAIYFNSNIPKRFTLSEMDIFIRFDRFLRTPKRQLLKDLYRAWRKYGRRIPRGFTFPPLRYAKAIFDVMPELLNLMQKAAREECEPHEFEEHAIELLSQVHESRVRKA